MYSIKPVYNRGLFALAELFVAPDEIDNVSLMELIQHESEGLFLICNENKFAKKQTVCGVFFYGKAGGIVPFIPKLNGRISFVLRRFFLGRQINVISGHKLSCENLQKALHVKLFAKEKDERDMYMMQYGRNEIENEDDVVSAEIILPEGFDFRICNILDANDLMPLQIGFVEEESKPWWKKEILKAAELKTLESNLQSRLTLAVVHGDGKFAAKIYVNAETKKYSQIGGVYTVKDFRGRGLGKVMVEKMARLILESGKEPVLFVRKKNNPALACYQNAGFKVVGEHYCCYYR